MKKQKPPNQLELSLRHPVLQVMWAGHVSSPGHVGLQQSRGEIHVRAGLVLARVETWNLFLSVVFCYSLIETPF